MPVAAPNREGPSPDPFWYKTGVIYELHVRAFFDTNADGTGDFRGLTAKLDYIRDLGVTAVWLLPFYPSPLKDDGYDIANYCGVHPRFGTLGDFTNFLREAHRRGLRVITELVLNHTSDQHPWFQRARRAEPGGRWRKFYVWSDTPAKYKDARIIFKDVEVSNWTWDPLAGAYYWHRFFSHQPDLNYDNPEVHLEMTKVVDFWLNLGVDGLRLDAVPYLYEREGTNCENLPETHAFLRQLRAHVDQKYGDRMLLAEANQWPEDAVTYFGQGRGDECQMAFHFPLMPRLFMAVRMEDRHPIIDVLEQTPAIPETCQWALFLRNHDELTLEMVSDEERDYMYRMYANVPQARLNLGIRRRLAPLLDNDRKKIELLNALLFSLPGTPVLYYGDEIGLGENIYLSDRDGVRTPMQWSPDRNAGFSRANPQSLYLPIILDAGYHYEANNVETQLANPHSLLWWMRRLLALRKRWRALGEGKHEFLHPRNRKILSYLLRHDQETLLVVANLSRFVQPVDLDLAAFSKSVPIELFGRTEFPAITEQPYFLSLGPHGFYWFSLEPPGALSAPPLSSAAAAVRPVFTAAENWQDILAPTARKSLEAVLPAHLRSQAWFGGKSKAVKQTSFRETVAIPLGGGGQAFLTLVQVDYVDGDGELYALPLAFASGSEAERLQRDLPYLVIARLRLTASGLSGVVHDAVGSPAFCKTLLGLVWHRRRLKGENGEVEAGREPALRRILGLTGLPEPAAQGMEQHNSSVVYGDKLILKLFRRLGPGRNPEVELGRFLSGQEFSHAAVLAGVIDYRDAAEAETVLAVLHEFVPHVMDARRHALEALGSYYDRVITWVAQEQAPDSSPEEPLQLLEPSMPAGVSQRIGPYLESARLLGLRTAELHLALASAPEGEALAPEPMTAHHLRGTFQSMRYLAVENLRRLREQLEALPPNLQAPARRALELQGVILQCYRRFSERRLTAQRIRVHGDCHLGQVLWTGADFVFIDFEGEPSMAISRRCIKRSPLRDVATMLRSLHYATYTGLESQVEAGRVPSAHLPKCETWAWFWNRWVSAAFLKAYFFRLANSDLLPRDEANLRDMLRAYLLDQIISELGPRLTRPSDGLITTLQGILYLAN